MRRKDITTDEGIKILRGLSNKEERLGALFGLGLSEKISKVSQALEIIRDLSNKEERKFFLEYLMLNQNLPPEDAFKMIKDLPSEEKQPALMAFLSRSDIDPKWVLAYAQKNLSKQDRNETERFLEYRRSSGVRQIGWRPSQSTEDDSETA